MQEKIEVCLNEQFLFDFMMYHTFSKFSGFLVSLLGVSVAITGVLMKLLGRASWLQLLFYIISAVVFLAYVPLQLRKRAKTYCRNQEDEVRNTEYCFDEEGIRVSGSEQKFYPWEQISSVVAAPKTIGFYYAKEDALIIPKEQFGDSFITIMKLTSEHIGRDRMRLS